MNNGKVIDPNKGFWDEKKILDLQTLKKKSLRNKKKINWSQLWTTFQKFNLNIEKQNAGRTSNRKIVQSIFFVSFNNSKVLLTYKEYYKLWFVKPKVFFISILKWKGKQIHAPTEFKVPESNSKQKKLRRFDESVRDYERQKPIPSTQKYA